MGSRTRTLRRLSVCTALLAAGALAVVPAVAAPSPFDVDEKVPTWDVGAARLGIAGSLWEPANSLGLPRTRRVVVIADHLTFGQGAVLSGDTYAGSRYGARGRSFWLDEKWANTGWAAEPPTSTSRAPVGRVRIRLGSPGMRTSVTARVFANCFPQPTNADPQEIPRRFRCERSDVLRTGGTLVMTARPASQMTAPGNTSVVIRSSGLRYSELVAIASSLVQVAGAAGSGAGSAQMVGMCRQMTEGAMTFDQASAFAQANGYTVRVGSIDGQPQAVTMDYRPDRFTVALASGVVTSCSYG
jgi:hypothetical protein